MQGSALYLARRLESLASCGSAWHSSDRNLAGGGGGDGGGDDCEEVKEADTNLLILLIVTSMLRRIPEGGKIN